MYIVFQADELGQACVINKTKPKYSIAIFYFAFVFMYFVHVFVRVCP